jgi:hypothetical protein
MTFIKRREKFYRQPPDPFQEGNGPWVRHLPKKGVMLSSVEAWWAGLYALLFDGAQGDSPLFGYYLFVMSNHGLSLSRRELNRQHSLFPTLGVTNERR